MKTAELNVPRWVAGEEAKKWDAGKTEQDRLIAKAFRAIQRGKKVIDLYETMALAGVDESGRPKLAIGRADATTVDGWLSGNSQFGTVYFRSNRGRKHDVSVPASYFDGICAFEAAARVPIIPPLLRQAKLGRLHILFEAAWQDVTRDPFLLEHLGGALYRVVGVWDLTPVERAVLRGRRL